MDIKKNHIRVGDYVVQYNIDSIYNYDTGFVVLDTTQNNAQIGYAHDHLCDALENILKY